MNSPVKGNCLTLQLLHFALYSLENMQQIVMLVKTHVAISERDIDSIILYG